MSSDRDRTPARDDFYRLIAGHAMDVFFQGSNEGVIEWVSPSVTALLGWAPEELVGTSAPRLWHPDDLEEQASVLGGLRPGETAELTTRILGKDGA